MKKVLCGLVIALMMTGNVFANKLIDKINKLGFGSPYNCTQLGKRIDFHNRNAENIYNFVMLEIKADKSFEAYEKHKSNIEHNVLMARENLEIYHLMCSVD